MARMPTRIEIIQEMNSINFIVSLLYKYIDMVDNRLRFYSEFVKFVPHKEKFGNFTLMFLHLFIQRTTSNLTIAMNHYLKPLEILMSHSIYFTHIIQNKKNYHLDRDSSCG
jgi:hypothetical protein